MQTVLSDFTVQQAYVLLGNGYTPVRWGAVFRISVTLGLIDDNHIK
jgi:hypothetical protein